MTWHPVEQKIARILNEHKPTRGMRVTMGETCQCGYWTGNEEPGKTRPVGLQGLDWHVSREIFKMFYGQYSDESGG